MAVLPGVIRDIRRCKPWRRNAQAKEMASTLSSSEEAQEG
jgi:hypothetical protein